MSGGVGPTAGGGITLAPMGGPPAARPHHHHYHFSIRHVIALGVAAVLAFSTTVPLWDIAFAVLLLPYLLFLAWFAFPQRQAKANPAAPVASAPADRLRVAVHMAVGFVVGAVLPALYILDGLRAGDTAGVAAAAPHALLLSAQVFYEGVAAAWPGTFSLPVAAAVPVMFNARRMFTASEWLREELHQERAGPPVAPWRAAAGRALAAANLAFWGFNLFGFLLPFYLPKVLRRYYLGTDREEDGEDQTRANEGEGKKDS
ncbi:unnamed protein product [Urochloa decumbens]|uniref:DUF7733 domain-containing protein n=1 Tax=Urochloa decumbens TaxID=240449 RepID=A0ABC8XDE7_9POAL